jgi:hypothetical protein
MADLIRAGQAWGVCVTSSGTVYVLIESAGYLMMYKNSGSGWSNVGTNQYYTTVHGKKGAGIGYSSMDIDSSDNLRVVDLPLPAGVTIDVAYAIFNTSTDTWGTWVEIAADEVAYTTSACTVMVDASDYVWVAWGNQDSKSNHIVWCTTNRTGSWVTTQIDSGSGYAEQPHLGIDSSGNVHFYWYDTSLSDPCYRQWTSGAGWGSIHSETGDGMRAFNSKVICSGSSAWFAGYCFLSSQYRLYRKDRTNNKAAQDDGASTIVMDSDCGTVMDQTILGSKQYIAVGITSGSYNKIYLYEYVSGTTWTLKWVAGDGTATMTSPVLAYSPHNANYGNNAHLCWVQNTNVYYEMFSGTPISNTQHANTAGGGYPTGSIDAYMTGDYPRWHAHSFAEGFQDGKSVRRGWMRGKATSIPAYLKGTENWYFDVVPFTAKTSTGTQDITGSLGGLQPKIAFFIGHGATSNDTITSDIHESVGWTDGVTQLLQANYIDDGSGSSYYSSGIVTTTKCHGIYYSSGGQAAFDSWITNGVRINWSTASGVGAYPCAALLLATDTPDKISSTSGSYSISNAVTDDLFEINCGFKPDLIIFFTPQDGSGIGLGMCQRNPTTDTVLKQWCQNIDYYSSYFNWPGYYSSNGTLCIADGINSNNGRERFKVASFTPTGFFLQCTANDGEQDTGTHYYIAIKNDSEVLKIATYLGGHGSTIGNYQHKTGFNTKAALMFGGQLPSSGSAYSSSSNGHGFSMFDGSNSLAGSHWTGYAGDVTVAKQVSHNARAVLQYNHSSTKICEATVTSMDANGFTLNYTTTGGSCSFVAFGVGYDSETHLHAFMTGHADFANVFLRGNQHTKSSQKVFFNVVDAMTNIDAYCNGVEPQRSDISAYVSGADNPLILPILFTAQVAGGSQSITDSRLNGLTPKAALIYMFYGDSSSQAFLSIGITDGTNSYVQHKFSKTDTGYQYSALQHSRTGSIILVSDGSTVTPALDAEAEFTSFIANGMTINWVNAPPIAYKGVIVFFCGSELSAEVNKVAFPSSPGTLYVTDPGFTPDMVIGLQHYDIDADYNSLGSSFTMSFIINDGHSPYPTQTCFTLEHTYGSPSSLWADSFGLHGTDKDDAIWQSAWLRCTAFTANGFNLYVDYSNNVYDYAYLAIKFDTKGRRKAHITNNDYSIDLSKSVNIMKVTPKGNYNILPETVIGFPNMLMWIEDDHWADHDGTWPFLFYGGGLFASFINSCSGAYINPSQFYDQYSQSIFHNNLRTTSHRWVYGYGWRTFYDGNISLVTNGIQFDKITYDPTVWPYMDMYPQYPFFLIWGLAEYKSDTSAYMKGQKINWRGRLPIGAYASGVEAGTDVDSSVHAYLLCAETITDSVPGYLDADGVIADQLPAFTEGFLLGTSVKAVYLFGDAFVTSSCPGFMYGAISSNQDVFLSGIADTSDQQTGFLQGSDSEADSQAVYLLGSQNEFSSSPSFTNGISEFTSDTPGYLFGVLAEKSNIPVFMTADDTAQDSVSAFLTSGTLADSSIPCYMDVDYLRDKLPAFLSGSVDFLPAYLEGVGLSFPFEDDFTGANQETWSFKWVTEEE